MTAPAFRRYARHRGVLCRVLTVEQQLYLARRQAERVRPPRPPSVKVQVEQQAERLWRRYGDMFVDWAVSGFTDEERERFIGGGDRKLDRRAREGMEDGLSDAMHVLNVPLRLADRVRRRALKIAGVV